MKYRIGKGDFFMNLKKKLLVAALATAMVFPTVSMASKLNVQRYSGNSRVETAVNVSKDQFSSAKSAILVNQLAFPDALSATVLSKGTMPVLFAESNKISADTLNQLKSMGVENVYVLGGEKSVSNSVVNSVKSATNAKVVRINGANRYKTNAQTIKDNVKQTSEVVIASGEIYVDALYGVSYANKVNAPVMLVEKNNIPAETLKVLKSLNVTRITIIGGEKTITPKLEKELSDIAVVDRISGSNRYEGSLKVAKEVYGDKLQTALVASGENFADALVAAPVSQKLDAPILLASKNSVESSIVSYLRDNKELANIKVFGGVNAIGSKVFKDLENSYYIVGENGEKVIDGGTIIVEKVKNNSTDKPNATSPVETGTNK